MRRGMPSDVTQALGRTILLVGILLAAAGLFLLFGKHLPGFLGRLPGDITLRRGNVRVYLPLGTCVLLSLILTLVLAFLSFWRR